MMKVQMMKVRMNLEMMQKRMKIIQVELMEEGGMLDAASYKYLFCMIILQKYLSDIFLFIKFNISLY